VSNYHYYFLPLFAKGIKSHSEAGRKMHFGLVSLRKITLIPLLQHHRPQQTRRQQGRIGLIKWHGGKGRFLRTRLSIPNQNTFVFSGSNLLIPSIGN